MRRHPRLGLDELWSFGGRKRRKAWRWLAVDRDSRRIVTWVVGSRCEATARRLWAALPPASRRHVRAFTDAWAAYAAAVPPGQHRPATRKGPTNLVEGLHCWLRQRCPVLVRKTCSFSKCWARHCVRIKIAIDQYNDTIS